MKSAVFYGKHEIRIEELEVPKVKEDEVLIQIKACGVCGTDVHIYEGDKGAAQVTPPTILGHEFSGIIKKTGHQVTQFQLGDRVCIDPNFYCGMCEPCRLGAHYCEHMIVMYKLFFLYSIQNSKLKYETCQLPVPEEMVEIKKIYN